MNTPGEAVCMSCGRPHRTMDMVTYANGWVCAGCKPAFFQRLQQGDLPYRRLVYGGFWERFAAKLIDGILLYILQLPVSLAFGISPTGAGAPTDVTMMGSYMMSAGFATLVNIGIGVSLTVFFLGKYGATPGKMALKLKVVRPNGEPITYATALGRYFAEMVSSLTCTVGYIIAAFDDEKRALHDRIASTRVIRAS